MAEVEFIYNGIKTVIQCNINEKMKDICQRFKDKVNIDNNMNIFYSYNGKPGINEELTFEEISNREDKRRNKMSILVYDNQAEALVINKEDKKKSKNIICPECKEKIKMEIKDYKINLYDCINKHKIDNILLNEFEETQIIDIILSIIKLIEKLIKKKLKK